MLHIWVFHFNNGVVHYETDRAKAQQIAEHLDVNESVAEYVQTQCTLNDLGRL